VALARWLEDAVPDSRDATVELHDAPVGTGFSSDTVVFDAAWRGSDGPAGGSFVARLRPTGYTLYQEHDLEKQWPVIAPPPRPPRAHARAGAAARRPRPLGGRPAGPALLRDGPRRGPSPRRRPALHRRRLAPRRRSERPGGAVRARPRCAGAHPRRRLGAARS